MNRWPPYNSDFHEVYETLNAEELATMKRVRAFMEFTVAPVVAQYWVDDPFSFGLLPALKELGIGGLGMQDYGCAGGVWRRRALCKWRLARTAPSFATFIGLHNGLSMDAIYLDASEEQKQKWLPPMARLEGSAVSV